MLLYSTQRFGIESNKLAADVTLLRVDMCQYCMLPGSY